MSVLSTVILLVCRGRPPLHSMSPIPVIAVLSYPSRSGRTTTVLCAWEPEYIPKIMPHLGPQAFLMTGKNKSVRYHLSSSRHARAAALDSLDLLDRPGAPPEARGELVAVKKHAVDGLDGGQGSGGGAADAGLGETGPGAA